MMRDPVRATHVRLSPNVRSITDQFERSLNDGWRMLRSSPSAFCDPGALLRAQGHGWSEARVPGTVASNSDWNVATGSCDAWDYWYHLRFRDCERERGRAVLCLDGLATLADVWLDGSHILHSDNMFISHALDITGYGAGEHELFIRFAALEPWLHVHRSRGRWPTRLVSEKHLRFVRTTLLGYMPGWCPAIRPVGTWRPVHLVVQRWLAVEQALVAASFVDGQGELRVSMTCEILVDRALAGAQMRVGNVSRGSLACERISAGGYRLSGSFACKDIEAWWPHTHGEPAVYPVDVVFDLGGHHATVSLGRVGFRRLELAGDHADFAFRVNGERLFCRGACWCPLDITRLHVDGDSYRETLERARDCGINMIRVGGTMVYESDDFYDLCDQLGILVWQDFMFANMDYPVETEGFVESCEIEARQMVERLANRPCLAVLCGGSEILQQAAMMGLPRDSWDNPLFETVLPAVCRELCSEVPYVSSTPKGGAMPFHVRAGPSHYYGVGAYLRPLEDVRLANVRFASECLAFSQVPDDSSLQRLLGAVGLAVHHPRYRERVPRDPGVGWDFGDVTDHYVELLFKRECRRLRYQDPQRYFACCRVAIREVMAHVQQIWRRHDDPCSGALVWLYRDPWEGAGWGILTSTGLPKASYWYLKRAWASVALWFVDEGVDGLSIYGCNETSASVAGTLVVELYRNDGKIVERSKHNVELAARRQAKWSVDELIGRFIDINHAYRFGPPIHTVVTARLESGAVEPTPPSLRAFYLPSGLCADDRADVGLVASATLTGDGSYLVTAAAANFAQSVSVDAPGYLPTDNYFHLAPGVPHRFLVRPLMDQSPPLYGHLRALNAIHAAPIVIQHGSDHRSHCSILTAGEAG